MHRSAPVGDCRQPVCIDRCPDLVAGAVYRPLTRCTATSPGPSRTWPGYLHQRTGGMIGSLLWLIRSAAIQAVIDGTEKITRKSMDAIPVDIASQAGGPRPRAIERKHHVGRRTIIKALNSADPPARKKIHREPVALNGLHGHIDAMIKTDPALATASIWQRLADDHGTTVAYPILRTYVVGRRSAPTP